MFQPCEIANSTRMLCPTPQVNIPEAFRDWEDDFNDPLDDVLDDFMITADADGHSQTLDFYLGFTLDDYQAYKNLSNNADLADYSKILYFTKLPEVYPAEFQTFVPNSGARIRIEVTKGVLILHLQQGFVSSS